MADVMSIGPGLSSSRDWERQRRQQMAQILGSGMPNTGHWSDGLAAAGSKIAGAMGIKREDERQKQMSAREREAMAAAVSGYNAQPWDDPNTPEVESLGTAGGMKGAAAALANYSDTDTGNNMLAQFLMGDINQQQRQAEDERKRQQDQETWEARFNAQNEFDLANQPAPAAPDPWDPYKVVGGELLAIDPETNQPTPVYSKQSESAPAQDPWDPYKVVDGNVLEIDPETGRPTPVYSPPPEPEPVSGPDVDGEGKLRKEFNGVIDSYIDVRDSFGRIIASAQDPSGAGDLALIFNYMKVLDPASTVRDSEFATAEQAGGVPAQVLNTYNKVFSGERLAPEQRADFVDRATRLYKQQEAYFKGSVDQYSKLAEAYGFDPTRIVGTWSNNIPSMPNQGALVGAPQQAVPAQTPAPQPAPTPAPQPAASGQFQMVEDQDFGSIPVITTQEQWDALPPGSYFRDAEGNVRQVPPAANSGGARSGSGVR